MSRPLFEEAPELRRRKAEELVGRRARVVVDALRSKEGPHHELEGLVLSVAHPLTGAQADALILRRPGYRDAAISLATVRTIEEL